MKALETFERIGLFTKDDAPVPLVGVKANGTITGRTARVSIRQRFENRENKAIEAVYKFPLPEGSSVCGFTVAVGDRVLRGRVEEREKAFVEYDEALAQGHGAFLLDEERPNIVTLSVGNVKPNHAVDIEISYVTLLDANGSEVRFVLPTTISPRYVPADMPDKDGIPVDKLINPELRLEVPYGLQLHLDVVGRKGITGVECPSHPIRTSYTDDAVAVEFSSDTVAMDHDFVLTVTYKDEFESRGYTCSDDHHTYVQLDFSPRFDDAVGGSKRSLRQASEIIFLLDCSGSMGGSSIEQAKKALEAFLRGLPSGSLFNVYRFGSTFGKLWPHSVVYDEKTLATALQHLAGVDANLGGTELLTPLRDIYGMPTQEGMVRNVILLTDGQVGNEADILALAQGAPRVRVFTVGIGYGPNEYLTKKLAALSGGATEAVAPGERIEPKVLRLFGKVMKGAVEELVVEWGASAEQAPLRPAVYDGECISLLARLPAGAAIPDLVRVHGAVGGNRLEWPVAVNRVDGGDVALPLLWARARISDLEEGVVAHGGSRQVDRKGRPVEGEIVAISKQYGILSRSTSFITVEFRTDAEKSTGEIELRKVPSMLTRGWGGVRESMADMHFMAAPSFARMTMHEASQSVPGAPLRHRLMKRGAGAAEPVCCRSVADSALSDQLADLLALQTAGGGFVISDEAAAESVGLNLAALKQAASRLDHGGPDPLRLVCTAVILAILQTRFADRRAEWFAVTEKSRTWFDSEVKRLNPTMDGKPIEEWAARYV